MCVRGGLHLKGGAESPHGKLFAIGLAGDERELLAFQGFCGGATGEHVGQRVLRFFELAVGLRIALLRVFQMRAKLFEDFGE